MADLTFTAKLKAYLYATNTKPSVLSRKMGVPYSTVRQWVCGRSEPSMYSLRQLVKATGYSADWWVM